MHTYICIPPYTARTSFSPHAWMSLFMNETSRGVQRSVTFDVSFFLSLLRSLSLSLSLSFPAIVASVFLASFFSIMLHGDRYGDRFQPKPRLWYARPPPCALHVPAFDLILSLASLPCRPFSLFLRYLYIIYRHRIDRRSRGYRWIDRY